MLKKVPATTTTKGYVVYEPSNYDATKKWPCVYFFHGNGEKGDGTDAGLQTLFDFINSQWYNFIGQLKKDRCLLIAIQLPWNLETWPLSYCDDAIAISKKYNVDQSRMYLSGVSRGGDIAWGYPGSSVEKGKMFADILACCCVGTNGNWANIKSPVLAYHAKNDPVVAYANSESITNAIKAANPPEIPQLKFQGFSGHEIWGLVYGSDEAWDWMLSKSTVVTPPPTPTKTLIKTIKYYDDNTFEEIDP